MLMFLLLVFPSSIGGSLHVLAEARSTKRSDFLTTTYHHPKFLANAPDLSLSTTISPGGIKV